MKLLILSCILFSTVLPKIIFDFNKESNIESWQIVDDVVMGGKSSGNFTLNSEGYGVFEGDVSLENNGGFSSVKHNFTKTSVKEHTKIAIKLKGDGKKYQFRIKTNKSDYYSYINTFETSGNWEKIEINLKDMYPSFRGRKLDKPNFSGEYIEEVTFLIANYKKESFKLLIDNIMLKE